MFHVFSSLERELYWGDPGVVECLPPMAMVLLKRHFSPRTGQKSLVANPVPTALVFHTRLFEILPQIAANFKIESLKH